MNNIYTLQCCTNVRILYVPYTVVISLRNITEIIISKLDSVRGCERVVQRVWNVYRGPCKLSRRRMIWLLPPPPLPPSPPSVRKLPLFLSLPVCRQSSLRRVGRGWGRSQIIRRRESLVLYKLFNPLWGGRMAGSVEGHCSIIS
jgi:hypothetical protein